MAKNRDDFTNLTKQILAQRVSYICSNPKCKKTTVAANFSKDKTTNIGIAAHITAASPGGPRYVEDMDNEERQSIDNGIWLCSNCAALIDREVEFYTTDLLVEWKYNAERESWTKLNQSSSFSTLSEPSPKDIPRLEVDFIPAGSGRSPRGFSNRNPTELHDGKLVMVPGPEPIIYWTIYKDIRFVIYNNSSVPAFNIQVSSVGDHHFSALDVLPKINNLPPLENLELKARYETMLEGSHIEADKIRKIEIPKLLDKIKLKLTYQDEDKNGYEFLIVPKGDKAVLEKVIK
jgi:hypothetical protein